MVGSPKARMVKMATIVAEIASICVIARSPRTQRPHHTVSQARRGIRVNPKCASLLSASHPRKDNVYTNGCRARAGGLNLACDGVVQHHPCGLPHAAGARATVD